MSKFQKDSLLVILGNQLFPVEYLSSLNITNVYMKEDLELCTYFKHHKMKLALFLTSMRDYRDLLKKKGFDVFYESFKPLKSKNKNYFTNIWFYLSYFFCFSWDMYVLGFI